MVFAAVILFVLWLGVLMFLLGDRHDNKRKQYLCPDCADTPFSRARTREEGMFICSRCGQIWEVRNRNDSH